MKRTDTIEIQAGIAHLPEEFREIARKANQAGLEGWKFVTADYGLDSRLALVLAGEPPTSRVEITYEKPDEQPDSAFERAIVSITEDGDGFLVDYSCGHSAVWAIEPAVETVSCAECVNAFLDKVKRGEARQ